MSIDQRLSTGLTANARALAPDVDRELAGVLRRARRRQLRHRGVAVAVVAAVGVVTWWAAQSHLGQRVEPVVPGPTVPRDLEGYRGPLSPGSYTVHAWGGDQPTGPLPRAVITVPPGYWSNGGFVIDAGADGSSEWNEYGVVQISWVDEVFRDPCDTRTAEGVAPTVADTARALVRQAGPSTRPVRTELDGHRGVYLAVTVPRGKDLDACTTGEYPLWRADPDLVHGHSDRSGIVHHLWILDVDGTRLVVTASTYPTQTRAERLELVAIAESVHFVAGPT